MLSKNTERKSELWLTLLFLLFLRYLSGCFFLWKVWTQESFKSRLSLIVRYHAINWRDTTDFDYEDDCRTGCRSVSHCQQQQSYSGLHSPGRPNSTYCWCFFVVSMKFLVDLCRFLQAVSIKLVYAKTATKICQQFVLQLGILVEFVILTIYYYLLYLLYISDSSSFKSFCQKCETTICTQIFATAFNPGHKWQSWIF